MAQSRSRLDFILRLTDYFNGHWEDPSWGRLPGTQVLVALAVNELSARITDAAARAQIQTAARAVVSKNAGGIVGR
jgi:hypothetical protein